MEIRVRKNCGRAAITICYSARLAYNSAVTVHDVTEFFNVNTTRKVYDEKSRNFSRNDENKLEVFAVANRIKLARHELELAKS